MQHLQDLAAVLLDAAAAEATDLAHAFQAARRAPGQFQGLLVRQDHEQRHPLAPGRVAAPRGQPLVPRTLGLVQFGQEPQERLATGIDALGECRPRRRRGLPCSLEGPRLQVDREAWSALVDEEVRFRAQDLARRQVRPYRPVVEQPGPRIHGNRQHPDLNHRSRLRRSPGGES